MSYPPAAENYRIGIDFVLIGFDNTDYEIVF